MRGERTFARNLKDFFKGFFITAAFIVPVYAAVFYMSLQRMQQQATAASQTQSAVPLPPSDYTLLSGLRAEDGTLGRASLIRLDVSGCRVVFCELPKNTVVLNAKMPALISDVYGERGLSGVAAALEATLGLRVNGTLELREAQLETLCDRLGGFSFTAERTTTEYDEQGILSYSKSAGLLRYCGADVVRLLRSAAYTENDSIRLAERLFETAISAFGDAALVSRLSEFYSDELSYARTDLATQDVYLMSKALEHIITDDGCDLASVRLPGSFAEGRYELAEDASRRMEIYFPAR